MFKPTVNIVELSKQSDYVIVKDTTTNFPANVNGWGVPNGPTASIDIINVVTYLQYLGSVPIQVISSNLLGDIFTNLKVLSTFADGVYTASNLYGMLLGNGDYTSLNKIITLSITGLTFDSVMEDVTNIAATNNPNKVFKIKSLNSSLGTIELYEDWVDTDPLIKYYQADTLFLVLNNGDKLIQNSIADLASIASGCDSSNAKSILSKIILKHAAQISFACKDYSKAHKAATLLGNNTINSNCSTC